MARIGNCYMKKGDQPQALHWFEKSLSEHRDPEIVKKQKELEKIVREQQKLAYINPELSDQEKNKGNELFKKGQGFVFFCKTWLANLFTFQATTRAP
jgi:stress-induced-phosphoprotein 1